MCVNSEGGLGGAEDREEERAAIAALGHGRHYSQQYHPSIDQASQAASTKAWQCKGHEYIISVVCVCCPCPPGLSAAAGRSLVAG